MVRVDGRVSEIELRNLIKLMNDLKFTEEQKYQMYFMTFDDPYFVESFMSKCANLPADHKTVNDYLDMLSFDITSPNTRRVYKQFREEAKYTPPYEMRDLGVIEHYAKNAMERKVITDSPSTSKKIKLRMKG